jgi:AraC family transcriptional regulator
MTKLAPPISARRNWAEIIPNEVLVYQQSSWQIWPGAQLVHMAHRLPEFDSSSNFHAVFVYEGQAGRLRVTGDGRAQSIAMTPGAMSFAPAHIAFHSEPDKILMETIGLLIDPEWLQTQAAASGMKGEPSSLRPALGETNPRVAEILRLMNDDLKAGMPFGPVFGESLLAVLGAALVSHVGPSPVSLPQGGLSKKQVELVMGAIRDRLSEQIRLRELADLVGYSEHHFHRLFRQATGLRVHEAIMSHRLQRAKELLAHTDVSVSRIAAECGFSDAGHLARQLRRRRGLTPRQFRAESQR